MPVGSIPWHSRACQRTANALCWEAMCSLPGFSQRLFCTFLSICFKDHKEARSNLVRSWHKDEGWRAFRIVLPSRLSTEGIGGLKYWRLSQLSLTQFSKGWVLMITTSSKNWLGMLCKEFAVRFFPSYHTTLWRNFLYVLLFSLSQKYFIFSVHCHKLRNKKSSKWNKLIWLTILLTSGRPSLSTPFSAPNHALPSLLHQQL